MEATNGAVRAFRAVAGVLGLVALVGTLITSDANPTFTAANFFSYFTVESNILAAVVLLGLAAVPEAAATTEGLRAATTLYMLVTGVVYNLLLRGVDVGIESTPFASLCNELLHVVVPLALAVDWLVVAPHRVIGRQRAVGFLLFPLFYVGYSLTRGELTEWYPYPFLNPGKDGFGAVVVYSIALLVVMLLLTLGVEYVGARRARQVYGALADQRSGGDDPA